jgi:hypothetical protein
LRAVGVATVFLRLSKAIVRIPPSLFSEFLGQNHPVE